MTFVLALRCYSHITQCLNASLDYVMHTAGLLGVSNIYNIYIYIINIYIILYIPVNVFFILLLILVLLLILILILMPLRMGKIKRRLPHFHVSDICRVSI